LRRAVLDSKVCSQAGKSLRYFYFNRNPFPPEIDPFLIPVFLFPLIFSPLPGIRRISPPVPPILPPPVVPPSPSSLPRSARTPQSSPHFPRFFLPFLLCLFSFSPPHILNLTTPAPLLSDIVSQHICTCFIPPLTPPFSLTPSRGTLPFFSPTFLPFQLLRSFNLSRSPLLSWVFFRFPMLRTTRSFSVKVYPAFSVPSPWRHQKLLNGLGPPLASSRQRLHLSPHTSLLPKRISPFPVMPFKFFLRPPWAGPQRTLSSSDPVFS